MTNRPRPATALLAAVITIVAIAWASPAAASRVLPPLQWLAAGDSYSSGNGLPHSGGSCVQASPAYGDRVYSQFAAEKLGPLWVAHAKPNLVACSGAHTSWFFADTNGHPAQWVATAGRYDLVTFTFGGDDVGFANVLGQCTGFTGGKEAWDLLHTPIDQQPGTVSDTPLEPSDKGHKCPKESNLRTRIDNAIGSAAYQNQLAQIARDAVNPGGNIVVLGYPELVEDPKQWTGRAKSLGICFNITPTDADEIRRLAGYLNQTIGNAVKQVDAKGINHVHLSFLDVNSGSLSIKGTDSRLFEPAQGTRHNQCSADSWINGVTRNGTFHPRQEAHDAEGSMLADVIHGLDWSGLASASPAQKLDAPVPAGSGRVIASSCLNMTTSPGGGATVDCIPQYTVVPIDCTTQGGSVTGPYGATTIWDHTTYNGKSGYVTDAWLYTGVDKAVAGSCTPVGSTPPVNPPTQKPDAPVPAGTGRVLVSPCLNVTTSPGGGDSVACVPQYTIVTIDCTMQGSSVTGPYGPSTLWDHTTYNGKSGYVSDAWLYTGTAKSVAGSCAPAVPPPTTGGSGKIIISPCLNLRAGPNGNTALVDCVPDGLTIQIDCTAQGNSVTGPYGATTLWDHTTYNGKAGYVSDAWVYTGQSAPVAGAC